MSVRITSAVALRVVGQLRRDPRTIALIVGVPCVLMVLLVPLSASAERRATASELVRTPTPRKSRDPNQPAAGQLAGRDRRSGSS
jgi:hypothetical protein